MTNGGVPRMRGKAEQDEQKPKLNPWPGIVFLIAFMLCATAIVVAWIVAG
jgi:hypothetical protein